MIKDPGQVIIENQEVLLTQNSDNAFTWKLKQIQDSDQRKSMSQKNLDTYQFPSGFNSNRRNSEFEVDMPSLVQVKKNSELILQQNIANLAKINEEADSLSDQSVSMMDPSPKVNVELKDTWGVCTPRLDDT